MAKETLLTKEGFERKKAELEALERRLYQEIPERLKEAKEHGGGDIRENKEYIYLKQEQEFIEGEVRALRELLENARIISEDELRTDEVGIGTRAILEDVETGAVATYTLVPPAEVDLLQNRIGIDSPVGMALQAHGKGKAIVVQTPTKRVRYRVLGIERG
ncbi:MAG: GreA/GreB family elongation factor [Candidatus Acetothermia bacterium]|jgi:transcription elongation factor GreA|nr:GreA/GreB family elongation factor [Candidatus Acetothermia bacterium]